jgi:hypothetical protein
MDRVTIKYSVLLDLLRAYNGDVIIEEALKMGKIDIIDDISGEKIGEIPIKRND